METPGATHRTSPLPASRLGAHGRSLIGTLTTAHGPRGPVAVVANGPILKKAERVYASLGALTGLNVRVFTTLVEAERWLQTL